MHLKCSIFNPWYVMDFYIGVPINRQRIETCVTLRISKPYHAIFIIRSKKMCWYLGLDRTLLVFRVIFTDDQLFKNGPIQYNISNYV